MNPEAADLWRRAIRSLSSARLLAEPDPDRSASTAYYAAFYAVSAILTFEGGTTKSHQQVEAWLHRELIKTGRWSKERGQEYAELTQARRVGDYGGEQHVSVARARQAVEAGERILRAVVAGVPNFADVAPLE